MITLRAYLLIGFISSFLYSPSTSAQTFGAEPLANVQNAARAFEKSCPDLTYEKLVAYMLAPTWWEVAGADITVAPSPMTLSRNDRGGLLREGAAGIVWHPGIGVWQLDDQGDGTFMSLDRFNTEDAAMVVAEKLAKRFCGDPKRLPYNIFFPWYACARDQKRYTDRDLCVPTAQRLLASGLSVSPPKNPVDKYGGSDPRACRIAGQTEVFPCLYVDPGKAQPAHQTWWTQELPGAYLPLARPFYVYEQTDNDGEYEWRYWMAADTATGETFAARRQYGRDSRVSLCWISSSSGSKPCYLPPSSLDLCDVSYMRGACSDQANFNQFRSDGKTPIPIGGVTDESAVKIRGLVSDPKGKQIRLEIELRRLAEYGGSFTGERTQASDLGTSGRIAEIPVYGLINGRYHWRARTVNAAGERGPWISFGNNSDSAKDFTVQVGPCNPGAISGKGACGGLAQIGAQSATDVGETGVTLQADVTPNGSAATAFFEYGLSPSSLTATAPQSIGSGFIASEVRQDISGLTCDTTFQFRAVAVNSSGRSQSDFQTFRTASCHPGGSPPIVTTQSASEAGPTSVSLSALINPNGTSTNAFFEYGVTADRLSSTGAEQVGSGTVTQGFSQFVTGLTCDTEYFYRAAATNAFGMQKGDFLTLFTAPCPQQTCFLLSFKYIPAEGGDLPLATPSYSIGCTTGRYNPGEQIHITARPAPGWTVASWTGTQDDTSKSVNNLVSMPSYDNLVWVQYSPPCSRSFTIPSGGEVWKKGEPHELKWSWGGCGRMVNIQLIKDGAVYDTIDTVPATTESYTWTPKLSYENYSKYQIKVVDADDPSKIALTPFFELTDP